MFSRSRFLFNSIQDPNTMSKRAMQEERGEELVVTKSTPVSLISRSLSVNQIPCWIRVFHTVREIADWVGILIPQALRDRYGTESKTQRQVLKRGTEMTILFQVPRNNQRSSTEKLGREAQDPLTETNLTHHNLEVPDTPSCQKVFANVRRKLSRLEVFISATMEAAIQLGENYNENLFTYRNTDFKALKTLFDITQKLILSQRYEIKRVSTIEWHFTHWMRSTLLHDRVIKVSKAKVHVCSDWENFIDIQNPWNSGKSISNVTRILMNTKNYLELTENHLSSNGIFPRTHYSADSQRDPDKRWQLAEQDLKNLKIGSSSCLCSTTSIGLRMRITRNVFRILKR